MTVVVRPLTAETWDALAELFREGGDPRWCWCQYWRLRSKDFGAAKVPELREGLRGQAAGAPPGDPPGLVAFDGARAVGWVSLGPRDAYERIVRSRVIPKIDEKPVWSIVCFAVSENARGQGVGRALLDAAIEFARGRGSRPSRPTRSPSTPASRSIPSRPSPAPCRCSNGPASRWSPSEHQIRRARTLGSSSDATYGPRKHRTFTRLSIREHLVR